MALNRPCSPRVRVRVLRASGRMRADEGEFRADGTYHEGVGTLIGSAECEHLKEHDTDCPCVGGGAVLVAGDKLGRHVGWRANLGAHTL